MQETPIYKDVSLAAIKFESILQEIKSRSFTGFVKVSYWDMEDYLYYLRGEVIDGIRCFSNGKRERLEYKYYKPSSDKGVFSLYATSPLDIFAFKESLQDRITPYTFVGHGQELIVPIQLSHADPNRILEDIASFEAYGYMIISQRDSFGPHITFSGGKPVCLYKSGVFKHSGKETLFVDTHNSYVAVFRTEPEFVNFLASLDNLKIIEDLKLKRFTDIKNIVGKLEGGFYLLEVVLSYGLRLFMLLSGRSVVFKIVRDGTQVFTEKPLPISEGEYPLRLYGIDIRSQFTPLEVSFSSLKEGVEYVPREKLSAINKAFIEELGPIGTLIWKKVFERLGFDVDKLPENKLEEFINILAKEIPDEKHANRFIEKTRRWIG